MMQRSRRRTSAAWLFAGALVTAVIAGCGAHPSAKGGPTPRGQGALREPVGDPTEAAPTPALFGEKVIANLFSHPGPLQVSEVDMGPEWAEKGKVVWAASYAAADGSFAPLTLILFEGRYRGLSISDNQRELLRGSGSYKDVDFGKGRTGFALRAADDKGGAEETAAITSPRGRFELLLLESVPKGGPSETPETAAYRSLLMDHTVRLMESVTRGMSELWRDPR